MELNCPDGDEEQGTKKWNLNGGISNLRKRMRESGGGLDPLANIWRRSLKFSCAQRSPFFFPAYPPKLEECKVVTEATV